MSGATPLPLAMSRRLFSQLLAELHRRGQDERESGAFLLAHLDARPVAGGLEVTEVFYYDDLDAESLTGGITMHASGLSMLNQNCRANRLRVIADIHTHPSEHVRQSTIDSNHPMIALPGHIALIAPNYASGQIVPTDLGAHRLLHSGEWDAVYGDEVDRMLQVRPWILLLLARVIANLRPGKGGR